MDAVSSGPLRSLVCRIRPSDGVSDARLDGPCHGGRRATEGRIRMRAMSIPPTERSLGREEIDVEIEDGRARDRQDCLPLMTP
jgi:hypothetical protein